MKERRLWMGRPRGRGRPIPFTPVLESDELLANRVLQKKYASTSFQMEIDDRFVQLLALPSSWPSISASCWIVLAQQQRP